MIFDIEIYRAVISLTEAVRQLRHAVVQLDFKADANLGGSGEGSREEAKKSLLAAGENINSTLEIMSASLAQAKTQATKNRE